MAKLGEKIRPPYVVRYATGFRANGDILYGMAPERRRRLGWNFRTRLARRKPIHRIDSEFDLKSHILRLTRKLLLPHPDRARSLHPHREGGARPNAHLRSVFRVRSKFREKRRKVRR